MTIADMENTVPKRLLRRSNQLQNSVFLEWVRGMEGRAVAEGMAGYFVTLGAPAQCQESPYETQQYLNRVWARTRAHWGKRDICFFGVRMVQPASNQSPLWFVCLWCKPAEANKALAIFRAYAYADAYTEAGRDGLFVGRPMDAKAGEMLSWVSTAKSHFDSSWGQKSVVWASANRIRQFQTFGE